MVLHELLETAVLVQFLFGLPTHLFRQEGLRPFEYGWTVVSIDISEDVVDRLLADRFIGSINPP